MHRKPAAPKTVPNVTSFAALVKAISDVHLRTKGIAAKWSTRRLPVAIGSLAFTSMSMSFMVETTPSKESD